MGRGGVTLLLLQSEPEHDLAPECVVLQAICKSMAQKVLVAHQASSMPGSEATPTPFILKDDDVMGTRGGRIHFACRSICDWDQES